MSTTLQQEVLDQFAKLDGDKMLVLLDYIECYIDRRVTDSVEDMFSHYEDRFKAETASLEDKVGTFDGLYRLVQGLHVRLDGFRSSLGNNTKLHDTKHAAERAMKELKLRLARAEKGTEPTDSDFNKSFRMTKDAFKEADQFASELQALTGRVEVNEKDIAALKENKVDKKTFDDKLGEISRVANHAAQTSESAFAGPNRVFKALGVGMTEEGTVIMGKEGILSDMRHDIEVGQGYARTYWTELDIDDNNESRRIKNLEAEQKNIKSQMSSVQVRLTQQEESSVSPWLVIGGLLGAGTVTYLVCAYLFSLGTTPSLFWALGIGAVVALTIHLAGGSSSSDGVSTTSTTTAKEKFATFNGSQAQTEPVTKVTPTNHDAPASRGERH